MLTCRNCDSGHETMITSEKKKHIEAQFLTNPILKNKIENK